MTDFLIGWIIYQLIFIGVFAPLAYNSSIDKPKRKPEKAKPITTIFLMTVPLIWFMDNINEK